MELMRVFWQGDVVVKHISAGPRPIHFTDSRLQERGSEWEKTTVHLTDSPLLETGSEWEKTTAPADVEASAALTNTVSTASLRKGSRPRDLCLTPRCVSNAQLSLLLRM